MFLLKFVFQRNNFEKFIFGVGLFQKDAYRLFWGMSKYNITLIRCADFIIGIYKKADQFWIGMLEFTQTPD